MKNRPHSLQVRFASLAAIAGNDAAAAVRIARIRVRDKRVIGDCGTKCHSIRSAAQLAFGRRYENVRYTMGVSPVLERIRLPGAFPKRNDTKNRGVSNKWSCKHTS